MASEPPPRAFHVTAALLEIPIVKSRCVYTKQRSKNEKKEKETLRMPTRKTNVEDCDEVWHKNNIEGSRLAERDSKMAGNEQVCHYRERTPSRFRTIANNIRKIVRLICAPVPASKAAEAVHDGEHNGLNQT